MKELTSQQQELLNDISDAVKDLEKSIEMLKLISYSVVANQTVEENTLPDVIQSILSAASLLQDK